MKKLNDFLQLPQVIRGLGSYHQVIIDIIRESESLKAGSEKLQDELEHLKACKEFESNLQDEILEQGSPFVDVPDGATICSQRAWEAIKRRLRELEDAGMGVLLGAHPSKPLDPWRLKNLGEALKRYDKKTPAFERLLQDSEGN